MSRWVGDWYRVARLLTPQAARTATERHLKIYPKATVKVVFRRHDARPWHLYENRASEKRR